MTDEKHAQLVQDFANEHSIAMGGGIIVNHSTVNTSYKPVGDGMKYEDVNYLKSQMDGASSFLFWLRRNGYDIVQKKVNIKKG
jgi:hypothetical protein